MPPGRTTPELLRYDQARDGDARTRVMAHALDTLTAVTPAAVAAISPVDRMARAFSTGPVVAKLDSSALSLDLGRLHLAYLSGTGADDPFDPPRRARRP